MIITRVWFRALKDIMGRNQIILAKYVMMSVPLAMDPILISVLNARQMIPILYTIRNGI